MQKTNGVRQHCPFLTFSLMTIERLFNFQTHRWFRKALCSRGNSMVSRIRMSLACSADVQMVNGVKHR